MASPLFLARWGWESAFLKIIYSLL